MNMNFLFWNSIYNTVYSGCQYKWEEEKLERGDGGALGGLDVPDHETELGHRH